VENLKTDIKLTADAIKKIEETLQKGCDVELQNRKDGLVVLAEEKTTVYKGNRTV